jgi:alpha-tubulin suppressor-like RCC1 family protein
MRNFAALLVSSLVLVTGCNPFFSKENRNLESSVRNEKYLSATLSNVCLHTAEDTVKCWGHGDWGQLGHGNMNHIGDDETPSAVGVTSIGGAIQFMTTGGDQTCAVLASGGVKCWGNGNGGALGYGNTTSIGDNELPSSVGTLNLSGTVTQIAAYVGRVCVLLEGGTIKCWGANLYGQCGYGSALTYGDDENLSSLPTTDIGGVAVQVCTGWHHTCALRETGDILCWGRGESGRLGYGNTLNIGLTGTPAAAGPVNTGGLAKQVVCGANHTCALLDDNTVRCWGSNSSGQLGYGHTSDVGDNEVPATAAAVDVGRPVKSIAAGGTHTCVITDDGRVRCWGQGTFGALGYGNTASIGDDEAPASAGNVDVGGTVIEIAAGLNFTCALLSSGDVRCWGLNSSGATGHPGLPIIGDDEVPSAIGHVSTGVTVKSF